MCGRAYETYTDEELSIEYLNRQPLHLDGFRQTYNLAPTQMSPVVLVRDGQRAIDLFRWGLVPSWAKSLKAATKYSLINARGEDIAEKASYAEPFRQRRCVVPLSGFFEWKRGAPRKRPFAIQPKDRGILSVAGVWERFQPGGQPEPLHTFSIVTTRANALMLDIHDRMPVILGSDDLHLWLDPSVDDPDRLKPLLEPCPPDWLSAYEVSTMVNAPANNSPEVLQPLPEERSLFCL
ncbi:MAG: SOS response-associated peptidase [Acidobacteria bacterium]|nr:SOS response-associated peptidase [Acidobacteriota bacterium]